MKKLKFFLLFAFVLIFTLGFQLTQNAKAAVSVEYYVESGSFNSESSAKSALNKYLTSKGLWGQVRYYFKSGTFPDKYQAQNVVNSMSSDGLWSEIIADGSRYRVDSGSFNSEESAKAALNKYLTSKGLWGEVRYYFKSGAFVDRDKAQNVVNSMNSDGLWSRVVGNGTDGQAIVDYAKLQLGKPYVLGATGPNSFDCSGLAKYVYANFGITLPRTTYQQINSGQQISYDNLQAGDLVFFTFNSDVNGHVGIYIGNNQFIEAPKPGLNVRISNFDSYYRSVFSRARRIL